MAETKVQKLERKCEGNKTVKIKVTFDDGTKVSKLLCQPGTTLVTERSKKRGKAKKKKKNKNDTKRDGDVVLIDTKRDGDVVLGERYTRKTTLNTDGKYVTFECDGVICFVYGSLFRSTAGLPCNIANGNDDCVSNLACLTASPTDATGTCGLRDPIDLWYVDWTAFRCLQNCIAGEDDDGDDDGPSNCGGISKKHNELYATAEICCHKHLSWQEECTPAPLSDDEIGLENGLNRRPVAVFEDATRCWGNGEPCFDETNEFTCCSGTCWGNHCA